MVVAHFVDLSPRENSASSKTPFCVAVSAKDRRASPAAKERRESDRAPGWVLSLDWLIYSNARKNDGFVKNSIPTIFICIFIVVIWLRSIFWVVCGGFMLFQVRSPKRIGSICCSHFGSFVGTFNLNPKLGPAEPSSL